jgi:putative peptidoglycan lipid II flippase
MSQESSKSLSRGALHFFSGTLLSRVSGMFRDIATAFFFGASPLLASFFVAFRFVYLFRRLFGEGLLHQGFIPVFEAMRHQGSKKGALFFRDTFFTFALLLLLVVGGGECFLFFQKGEIYSYARYMIPGVAFICLFGLSSSLLHAEKSFFLPSVSSVAFNCVWILAILFCSKWETGLALRLLSCVISFAFLIQWALTLPKAWRYLRSSLTFKEVFSFSLFSKELRQLIKPVLLGIIGVAAVQINGVIDALFAKWASPEGPAYLWYAIRLQQLPLGLFSIALSSALLPSLSRSYEAGRNEEFTSLLTFAKKRTILLVLPCVIGIFVLGASSLNLLFGHGDFSSAATAQTTLCLWGYGIGLLPAALTQILAPAFYAKKDWRTPTQGFVLAALLNSTLDACLVFFTPAGPASIALATSIAAVAQFLFLSARLQSKPVGEKIPWKFLFGCLIAGGSALAFGHLLGDQTLQVFQGKACFSRDLVQQITQFALQAVLFFLILFAFCKNQILELIHFSR